MRQLLFLTFCISFYQLIGQTPYSGESIAVIGKASGTFVPDMVTFDFSINVTDKKQNIAVQKLSDQTETLITRIASLGFNPKKIILSSYNLHESMDYSGGKPKNNGYDASIDLDLSIKYKDKDFNIFIDSISATKLPDLSFTYRMSFSDSLRDSIKNDLIRKASDDATNIAMTLAKSRNLTLGNIFTIEYTANNLSLYGLETLPPPPPPPPTEYLKRDAPRISKGISMKGIDTEQQVRIVFRIINAH